MLPQAATNAASARGPARQRPSALLWVRENSSQTPSALHDCVVCEIKTVSTSTSMPISAVICSASASGAGAVTYTPSGVVKIVSTVITACGACVTCGAGASGTTTESAAVRASTSPLVVRTAAACVWSVVAMVTS